MIIDIEKKPSWQGMITDLKVGEDLKAPYSKVATIDPILSKLKSHVLYHDREFETDKIVYEGVDVRVIKRIK